MDLKSMKKMGKRGIFFTLTAVMVVMVIVTAFSIGSQELPYTSKIPVIKVRAQQADTLIRTLEGDILPRVIHGITTRAFLSMSEYANRTGSPFSDPSQNFTELIMLGTIGGQDLAAMGITYMEGHTFPEVMSEIVNLTWEAYKINLVYNPTPFYLLQNNETGPWNVLVMFDILLVANATLMDYDTLRSINVSVPIENIPDPYYSINFRTLDYRPIIRQAEVELDNWTRQHFVDHVRNATYYADAKAPSFLFRLRNDTSGHECCGIESMINPASYAMNLASPVRNLSFVDHCYFGKDCDASRPGDKSLWNVSGVSSAVVGDEFYGFVLTQYHIAKHNIDHPSNAQVIVE